MSKLGQPDELKEDALFKKLVLDTATDVQAALQLLIAKDVFTKEELDEMRAKVRTLPKYAASYQYVQSIKDTAELWEKDPQSYLQAMLKAKMDGKI